MLTKFPRNFDFNLNPMNKGIFISHSPDGRLRRPRRGPAGGALRAVASRPLLQHMYVARFARSWAKVLSPQRSFPVSEVVHGLGGQTASEVTASKVTADIPAKFQLRSRRNFITASEVKRPPIEVKTTLPQTRGRGQRPHKVSALYTWRFRRRCEDNIYAPNLIYI